MKDWPRIRGAALGEQTVARLRAARQTHDVNVLYTFDDEPILPENVRQALDRSPPSWKWWLRLHPQIFGDAVDLAKSQLDTYQGAATYEFDIATNTPLFELLEQTDVHVTQISSVTVEAQTFGVPSVITDRLGAEYYQKQIADGWAAVARSGAEIVRTIEQLAHHKPSSRFAVMSIPSDEENFALLQALLRGGKDLGDERRDRTASAGNAEANGLAQQGS
jgi:hypothetical protein